MDGPTVLTFFYGVFWAAALSAITEFRAFDTASWWRREEEGDLRRGIFRFIAGVLVADAVPLFILWLLLTYGTLSPREVRTPWSIIPAAVASLSVFAIPRLMHAVLATRWHRWFYSNKVWEGVVDETKGKRDDGFWMHFGPGFCYVLLFPFAGWLLIQAHDRLVIAEPTASPAASVASVVKPGPADVPPTPALPPAPQRTHDLCEKNSMGAFALAIFAWGLGLLGHRPIKLIQDQMRRREFRQALIPELDELRLKLAYNVFLVGSRHHTLTRATMVWLRDILTEYRGIRRDRGIEDMVTRFSALTDEQLRQLPGEEPGRSLAFKKYSLAFTSSILPALSLFPTAVQRRIVEICAVLTQLNEEIERIWFWHVKTFDTSLSQANAQVVRDSVEQSIREVGRMSQDIATWMSEVLAYCRTGRHVPLDGAT